MNKYMDLNKKQMSQSINIMFLSNFTHLYTKTMI